MNANLVMGVKRAGCGVIAGIVVNSILMELMSAIAVVSGVMSTAAFGNSMDISACVGSTIGLITWIYGRMSWRLIGIISGSFSGISVLYWTYVVHLNSASGASIIWKLLTVAIIETPMVALVSGLTAYVCILIYDKLDPPFAPVDVQEQRTKRPRQTYGEERPRINL